MFFVSDFYDLDVQFIQTVFPPPDAIKAYPEATEVTIGDSYYAAVRFLPPGIHLGDAYIGRGRLTYSRHTCYMGREYGRKKPDGCLSTDPLDYQGVWLAPS